MRKVHFTEATRLQHEAVLNRTHRYWVISKDTTQGAGTLWVRMWETACTRRPDTFGSAVIYVFDIIDNKVLEAPDNIRDLHTIASRVWPLKERMIEMANHQAKAKKSRRKMAKAFKTLDIE